MIHIAKNVMINGIMILLTIIAVIGSLLVVALPIWLSLDDPSVMAKHLPMSKAIIAMICMICGLFAFTPVHHHIEMFAPFVGVPLIFINYGICMYYFLGF